MYKRDVRVVRVCTRLADSTVNSALLIWPMILFLCTTAALRSLRFNSDSLKTAVVDKNLRGFLYALAAITSLYRTEVHSYQQRQHSQHLDIGLFRNQILILIKSFSLAYFENID